MMFQNTYLVFWDINNKHERYSAMILTTMTQREQANKVNK